MKRISSFGMLILFLTMFTSCLKKDDLSESDLQIETSTIMDEEEYLVYAAVIDGDQYKASTQIVYQLTNSNINPSDWMVKDWKENQENFDTLVLYNYSEKNDTTYKLNSLLPSKSCNVTLISQNESANIFDSQDPNEDWAEFYDSFPNSNGIMTFTRVGFNKDKTQALVGVFYLSSSLGGGTCFYYLIKENDIWTIKNFGGGREA